MLRALVALLLVANLGLLALSRGWLAPALQFGVADEREPQRLAAQIDPQGIQVLAPAAASARSCLLAGPFTAEQADAAEALLRGALPGDVAWARVPQPAHWDLVLPRPDDADAERREQERLRGQGYAVEPLAGGRSWSLGRYDTRAEAEAALAQARARALGELKLIEQPAAPRLMLRIVDADAAVRAKLLALPIEPAGFAACSRPR